MSGRHHIYRPGRLDRGHWGCKVRPGKSGSVTIPGKQASSPKEITENVHQREVTVTPLLSEILDKTSVLHFSELYSLELQHVRL